MTDNECCCRLKKIVPANPMLARLLDELEEMPELRPFDYYVSAGCITQTVWNVLTGGEPDYCVKDVDIVYFDPDLSEGKESEMARRIGEKLDWLPMKKDIKNEARVHLWYERRFGFPIEPCRSVEEAIRTWHSTATSIGVRKSGDGLKLFAPFGLDGLFGLIVRANKVLIGKEVYERKVERWIRLCKSTLGIDEPDVMVILIEPPMENWGGLGKPASDINIGFKIDV